jgi:hypothetical protein
MFCKKNHYQYNDHEGFLGPLITGNVHRARDHIHDLQRLGCAGSSFLCKPGHLLEWVTHFFVTLRQKVKWPTARKFPHWLTARPPRSSAFKRSSPVADLIWMANFSLLSFVTRYGRSFACMRRRQLLLHCGVGRAGVASYYNCTTRSLNHARKICEHVLARMRRRQLLLHCSVGRAGVASYQNCMTLCLHRARKICEHVPITIRHSLLRSWMKTQNKNAWKEREIRTITNNKRQGRATRTTDNDRIMHL